MNLQASQNEQVLSNTVNQRFLIVDVNFSLSHPSKFTVWVYNSGPETSYISELTVYNSTWSYSTTDLGTVRQASCETCVAVQSETLASLNLNAGTAFQVGAVYTFEAVGEYGYTYTYQVVR
ncbi:MAG: hypothetical protein QW767_05955 [Thermoprotei archaeon]